MASELLLRMTPEEKLAQLSAYMFFDTFWHRHDTYSEAQRIEFVEFLTPEEMIAAEGLGFITTHLRDVVAPVASPLKRLVDFARVALEPGRTAMVKLTVPAGALQYLDRELKPAFEPGDFDLMVGASAEDIRLTARYRID
jgi:hypothetical protein